MDILTVLSTLKKGDIFGGYKINGIFPDLKTIEVVSIDETFAHDNWNYGVLMEKQILEIARNKDGL